LNIIYSILFTAAVREILVPKVVNMQKVNGHIVLLP